MPRQKNVNRLEMPGIFAAWKLYLTEKEGLDILLAAGTACRRGKLRAKHRKPDVEPACF